MLEFKPGLAGHLKYIQAYEGMKDAQMIMLQDWYAPMLETELAISAWDGSTCLGMAGVTQHYGHKAQAWSLLSYKSGPYMRPITRKIRAVLEGLSYKRIEMLVDADFEAGHKWAKMLGFKVDAPRMIASGVFGNDETLYARIKQ